MLYLVLINHTIPKYIPANIPQITAIPHRLIIPKNVRAIPNNIAANFSLLPIMVLYKFPV